MTRPRHEFSNKTKLNAFLRCNGRCERCGARLRPAQYRYDHDIPDQMGGDNSLENCVVACITCDRPKTAADQTRIAKAKRAQRKNLGIRAPGRSVLPCGRASPWKKTFHHGVVRRDFE